MTETAATEEVTSAATVEPQKDEGLANKHGYIDLDKIEDEEVRQQVQNRLSGLYRDYKTSETAVEEMRHLYANMEKEVTALRASKEKEQSDAQLAEVRKGLADAQSRGEYEKAAEFQEKLVDLKTPKPAKPEQSNDLTMAQQNALLSWQAEMTDDGRIARPWANPGHARYRETIAELTKASVDPAIASQGFGAILDSVHEKMAPKAKPTPASPVAAGDATPPRSTGKQTKLTAQQERVARKMYPREKDPIAAYAKAFKQYGAQ